MTISHNNFFHYTDISRNKHKQINTNILKKEGIVGGFEFTVLQRNLKEWHERS